MKNFYLSTALVCFVFAVGCASFQMHASAITAAVVAVWNFILYKLEC